MMDMWASDRLKWLVHWVTWVHGGDFVNDCWKPFTTVLLTCASCCGTCRVSVIQFGTFCGERNKHP